MHHQMRFVYQLDLSRVMTDINPMNLAYSGSTYDLPSELDSAGYGTRFGWGWGGMGEGEGKKRGMLSWRAVIEMVCHFPSPSITSHLGIELTMSHSAIRFATPRVIPILPAIIPRTSPKSTERIGLLSVTRGCRF
jgi:hypothetical protein